jgi:hypothetical protein
MAELKDGLYALWKAILMVVLPNQLEEFCCRPSISPLWAARSTVLAPTPNCFAIADQEVPPALNVAIFDSETNTRGRLRRLPFSACISEYCFDTLDDKAALQLSNRAQNGGKQVV